MSVLDVQHLTVRLPTEDGVVHAVQDVSFSVEAGELFGVVGESGSGKSVLTQAITGLLPNAAISGKALFEGRDLLALDDDGMRAIRGSKIGMVFQDPLSSLHPYYTIGSQITELIHTHQKVSKQAAKARAIEMLGKVGMPEAGERFNSYPHQFSGGMRQRVMIAMALVLEPTLIIADEPTTALDVTVQKQIIDLLDRVRKEFGTTIVMITHDLGLLSNIADHIMVMYAGNRMELGASESVFAHPAHPYTAGLLRSSPSNYVPGTELVPIPGRPPSLLHVAPACVFADRCPDVMSICTQQRPPLRRYDDGTEAVCWLEGPPSGAEPGGLSEANTGAALTDAEVEIGTHDDAASEPLVPASVLSAKADSDVPAVEVRDVALTFSSGGVLSKRAHVEVLKGVDLELHRGETLGLVGESGCGKSTLARVIAGLIPATRGEVEVAGKNLAHLSRAEWQQVRREVQVVFQDPYGSLNPRRRVGSIIGDPYRIHGIAAGEDRKRRVQELMELVGLNPEHYNRFPSEFSGGQRQRIGIARALTLNPALIICDEPVSALDVSVQAQILNLLKSLQREFNLSYLFISHDLAVVRHVCDRIAVMKEGRIVELASTADIYANPQDPFTRTLLAASMSTPEPKEQHTRTLLESIPQEVPAA